MSLWVANKGEPEMGSPFRSRPSVLSNYWWPVFRSRMLWFGSTSMLPPSSSTSRFSASLISGSDAGDFRDQEAAKVDPGVMNFNKACPVVTNVRSVFGSSTIIVPAA